MSRAVDSWLAIRLLLLLLLLLGCCCCVIGGCCWTEHEDLVTALPGWNQPLPSRWFSGYLHYEFEGRMVHTHYILVQAENDDDDLTEKKPLIYWSNGGPGASSMFGLLTELGPLLLSDDSLLTPEYRQTGIPTPIYNQYSWTRLGSILVFDQPAPVGFSYCNDETNSTSCAGLSWTDELAAENAFAALNAFYSKFECYMERDLYLTGESYAGIYIPTLARRILLRQPDSSSRAVIVPLKGLAVGDGCLGTDTGICSDLSSSGSGFDFWHVMFLFGHGQIPVTTFQQVMLACDPQNEYNSDSSWWHQQRLFDPLLYHNTLLGSSNNDEACQLAMVKVNQQAGGYYGYNLYDDCTYRNGMSLSSSKNTRQGAVNDYACGGAIVSDRYLGLAAVQTALHVVPDNYFSVDNADNFDYTPTEKDLTGFYKDLLAENNDIRVLIYNGDADPAVRFRCLVPPCGLFTTRSEHSLSRLYIYIYI
jgi:carboxypeptidase C (cathepsin A)